MKHADQHLNFPWITFLRVMGDCNLEEEFENVACKDRLGHLLKGWSTYWKIAVCLTPGADLESILILMQEVMAEIESIHAAIRREMVVLSTQTHALVFLTSSADTCCAVSAATPSPMGFPSTMILRLKRHWNHRRMPMGLRKHPRI